uniref:Pinin/SDK/MemA protein domain-containing protein n=1 Tax=Strongyloides stercoralis TaxID=6248 RepID=A0A0K0ET53_STRER
MSGEFYKNNVTSREEKHKILNENVKAIVERERVLAEKRRKLKERRRTLNEDFLIMELRNQMLEESRQSLLTSLDAGNNGSLLLPGKSSLSSLIDSSKTTIVESKEEGENKNIIGQVKSGDVKDCFKKLNGDAVADKVTSTSEIDGKKQEELKASIRSKEGGCSALPTVTNTLQRLSTLKDKLDQKKKEIAQRRASRILKDL